MRATAIVIVILQIGSNHTNVTLFGDDGETNRPTGNRGGDGFDGSGGPPWFASSVDTHTLPRPAKPVHLKCVQIDLDWYSSAHGGQIDRQYFDNIQAAQTLVLGWYIFNHSKLSSFVKFSWPMRTKYRRILFFTIREHRFIKTSKISCTHN